MDNNQSVSILDESRADFGLYARKQLADTLPAEIAKRKIKRDVMLEAIPEDHEAFHELTKMVMDEYQVGMVEISSGNGRYSTDWNPEGLPMAQASEQSPENRSGMAEEIISDEYLEIHDFHMHTNDDGSTVRADDYDAMIIVKHSKYSIWDTIFQKGMLIVRKTGHWTGGKFDKAGYEKREAKRMLKIHRALLGMNKKFEEAKLSDYEERKQKRLDRLQARKGGNIHKIGFNAFS